MLTVFPVDRIMALRWSGGSVDICRLRCWSGRIGVLVTRRGCSVDQCRPGGAWHGVSSGEATLWRGADQNRDGEGLCCWGSRS